MDVEVRNSGRRPAGVSGAGLREWTWRLGCPTAAEAGSDDRAGAHRHYQKGPLLVDLKGMTLYYYERDTSGNKSACDRKCTESWTPLAASNEAQAIGDFTVITRSDGSKMWAYRYRPLYTSPADKAPGDANGNATTLQWRLARPEE